MSRRSRLLVAAIGVLLSDAALVAQDADAPSGLRLLRGVVVTGDDSRAPVRRVRVSATWTDGRSDPVFTDDRGRFEIAVPTSSSHTLSLTKAGFAPQQLFRARGLSPDAVEILMIRGAVITGTVLDPGGEPVVGLGVIVRRTDPSGDAYGSGEWTTETDDRGEFRVGSLPEGPFAVVLTNRRSSGAGWQSGIYLNGAVNRDTVVHAHAGQELAVSRVFEPPPAVGAVVVASLKVDDLRAALGGPAGGSIRGRVVGANGRPGAGVTVIASPLLDGRERTVSADAEGRYRIDLPPGAYRLIAGGSGANRFEVRDGTRRVITLYPDGMAAPDQLGRIVAVGDGERQEGIDLTVARGGVIAGTVTDEYGEPLEGLTIELWQARWTAGRTVVSRAAGIPARKADDRGYYRSYGLAPGSYYVVAIESPPKSEQQAPGPLRRVFHPAAPDLAEAIPVSIEPGRDALDVNLAFQPARLAQIRGRVSSGSGEVFQGSVRLVRLPLGAPSLESRSAEVAAGTFAFENVSPGEYTLDAASRQAPPDEVEAGASNRSPVERGTARVAVGPGESVDVAIHTVPTPGSSIDGRVVIKGEASRFPADFMVFAQPAEPA
jgi:protocatechuate 3,4-dioxygenase beta subunit